MQDEYSQRGKGDYIEKASVEILDHMKMASPSSVPVNKKLDSYNKTNPLNVIPESWEQESKASGLHES